ncbi:MAG: hypothetical protein ACRC9Q_05265 [Bacteroidales bacterium]
MENFLKICSCILFSFIFACSCKDALPDIPSEQEPPVTPDDFHSVAIPLQYYGVWDRGSDMNVSYDPKADYLLGSEIILSWAQIQAQGPESFDFSLFDAAIRQSSALGKILKFSINVGPDSPSWLYTKGVPLVTCEDGDHKYTEFPFYLNDSYKQYYFALIKAFAQFLRSQPASLVKTISFVQVKTGCTGDECAYKGVPVDRNYNISAREWSAFRLESFDVFREAFNEGESRKIPLLFNAIDPEDYATEYNWVNETIDPKIGYGVKGSAYVRGHHLTGEGSFKKTWMPFLVNPKGTIVFSAAEMDQTWQKPLYNINKEIGFYWGALSGLNTGLSSWNVSKSALEFAYVTPEIQEVFRFFNKYAGQIYPSIATSAYVIFHEGLNSANTVKFPEEVYGKARLTNMERYLSICNDPKYKSRGAQMDDPPMATVGQVRQRDEQKGYNDAGWDIEDGNYERWINQIAPEETSVALFRVRGPIGTYSSKYDRFARSFESASGKQSMYFKFDDEMFAESTPKTLTFTVTWLDKTAGSTWEFVYMAQDGQQRSAKKVTGIGDNVWKKELITISNPAVRGQGEKGSDFMLVNSDDLDDIFHGIEVDITR